MNPRPDPEKLAQVVAESAHQIWLAGLSAVSMAEKESSKFFETVSRLTENIQAQTVKTAGVARKTVSGSRHAATETWDKLEELFELRVGRALNALQIPTARDIKELTKRVDKLSKSVEEVSAKKAEAGKKAKKRKTATSKPKTGKKAKKTKTKSRTKTKTKTKTKPKTKTKTRKTKKKKAKPGKKRAKK